MTVDIHAVLRAVADQLEAPAWKGNGNRRWVVGGVRGREITVVCWHEDTRQGGSGWKVTSNAEGVPVLLRATRSENRLALHGAPARTAERVIDDRVREALLRLEPELHPPALPAFLRSAIAPPVSVDRGAVVVTSQGEFDASAVRAGIEVAVLLAERIAALADERRGAPASADEAAEIARLRKDDEPPWTRSPHVKIALLVAAVLLAVWAAMDAARSWLR